MAAEAPQAHPRLRSSQSTLAISANPSSSNLQPRPKESQSNLTGTPPHSILVSERVEHERAHGHWSHICGNTLAIVVPMAALAGGFLSLLKTKAGATGVEVDRTTYLVSSNPPVLLLLATLSSILALCLFRSVMSLASYLVAAHMLSNSHESTSLALPTPYHFGQLIRLLHGNWFGWLHGIPLAYEACKRRSGTRHLVLVPLASCIVGVLVGLIVASDIWLHLTVTTTEGLGSGDPAPLWSRRLSDDCLRASDVRHLDSLQVPLNDEGCYMRLDLLSDATEAYATAEGVSSIHAVGEIYLDENSWMSVLLDVDATEYSGPFVASSLGVKTTCKPITQDCQVVSGLSYDCSDRSFTGAVANPLSLALSDITSGEQSREPFEWFVAASASGEDGAFEAYDEDAGVMLTNSESRLFTILSCSSEVYNVNYYRSNGAIHHTHISRTDNQTNTLVLGAIFPGLVEGYAGFGSTLLESGMHDAAHSSRSSQQLADAFGLVFSKTAIASAAGSLVPAHKAPNGLTASTVTRVPRAPFLLLVIANIIYAATGLILGITAFLLCGLNEDVQNVQARLNIFGLVARAFEPGQQRKPATHIRDLFSKSDNPTQQKRVRIVHTEEGGWSWET